MQEEQQSSKQRLSKTSRFSIGLSFFVALFAVVSLIAAGFNNLSYAAPTISGNFVFRQAQAGAGNQSVLINGSSDGGFFAVPIYLANSTDYGSGTPVFCIEHASDADTSGLTYEKDSDLSDIGLLYILNKSRVLNENSRGIIPTDANILTSSDETLARKVLETYATQVAIWVYMYENYYKVDNSRYARHSLAGNNKSAEENYNLIKAANYIEAPVINVEVDFSGRSIFDTYIASVVREAQAYTGVKNLTVSKANHTISKVGDDGWYQSAPITVAAEPSNDLVSFDVSVSGVEGAIVVDKDGNEKSSFNARSGEDLSFFVRVPTNKVSQEASKVTVTVKGLFDNYLSGAVYKNGDHQKVVTVTGTQNYESERLSIDFMGVPDTGMSKAQTIYFIGLIVLLCGVGIVYANAKPAQTEE